MKVEVSNVKLVDSKSIQYIQCYIEIKISLNLFRDSIFYLTTWKFQEIHSFSDRKIQDPNLIEPRQIEIASDHLPKNHSTFHGIVSLLGLIGASFLYSRVGIPGKPIHGPSMDHRIPIDGTMLSSHRFLRTIVIFARE